MNEERPHQLQHSRSLSGPKFVDPHDLETTATPGEFIHKYGGKRVIEKILIANNGIGAVKFIRSVRRWSYEMFGNDKAIAFHVMVTPEDLKANAEYIRLADNYITVPGGSNNHNYANVELILDIAKRIPVQGVWAGWGHASENPKLPELLHKHDIKFLGPPAHAMWSLGDKIASSIVAQTANIPTLPWSGLGLKINEVKRGKHIHIPKDLFEKGCVHTVQQGLKSAEKIGYPVIIKASEGGGGKGIRKAKNAEEFPSLFYQVQIEVPGSPVFVMKLAKNARHLEVQILADEYGNAISLFGRDCSVQRRHQKIMEEAPAIIADPEVFYQMEEAAVRLAKMVGYVSAGTVEYLYIEEEKKFYFLELNPRLQVEHPCTEMVADVNLPALQLQIAMGLPLHRIKDIRALYKEKPMESTPIDFENPSQSPTPHGHVIACRITAENPDEGFQPGSGTVQELNFRSSKNVWGYFSVAASGGLHEYADSQFGHCFAWGESREQARRNMVLALKELSIKGDFRTTVEYLVTLLETESFHFNHIDTAWLDQLIAEKVKARRPDTMLGVICASLCISEEAFRKRFADYQALLERGQVMNAEMISNVVDIELIQEGILYSLKVSRINPTAFALLMNNSLLEVEVHRMTDGAILISLNGASYTTYMKEEVDKYRIVVSGRTCIFEKENDPRVLRSTSPGKLIRFIVSDGDHVTAGQEFAEIEVMKMVTSLYSTASGILHYTRQPGAILHPGTQVARLELDDPSSIKQANKFCGTLPATSSDQNTHGTKINQVFEDVSKTLHYMMCGYTIPDDQVFTEKLRNCVTLFLKSLKDPSLPLLELKELMSTIAGRIPSSVESDINKCLTIYAKNITSVFSQFPSQQLTLIINRHAASIQRQADQDQFFMNTTAMMELLQKYRGGQKVRRRTEILQLLKEYYRVEEPFQDGYDKGVRTLQLQHTDNCSKVAEDIFAHYYISGRNALTITLIEAVETEESCILTPDLKDILLKLSSLSNHKNSKVSLAAQKLLIKAHQAPYEQRYNQVESIFLGAVAGETFLGEKLEQLIKSDTTVFDILPAFFLHRNKQVQLAALEVYVRRAYTAYEVMSVLQENLIGSDIIVVEWQFLLPQNHPNRQVAYKRASTSSSGMIGKVSSLSEDLSRLNITNPPCQRTGVMAAFVSFQQFEVMFDSLMSLFLNDPDLSPMSSDSSSADLESIREEEPPLQMFTPDSPGTFSAQSLNVTEEPIHIINVGLMDSSLAEEQDEILSKKLGDFVRSNIDVMNEKGIRRITFIIFNENCYPRYFTFRARHEFNEDTIYRHLEPALAFQLEIHRLSNFTIQLMPTQNHRMHLYLGSAKVAEGQPITDHRFFIRSIIRHTDLITAEASFDYMEREGERIFLESLDQLQVASANMDETIRTDCNHIFLHFVPPIILEPTKIADKMLSLVSQYGIRLLKLRVTEAEIKATIRLTPTSDKIPIRVFLSSDNGVSVRVHMYQEIEDQRTGEIIFQSWGPPTGPLNRQKVTTPYPSKDHLQQKRYNAQNMETTYIYDFIEMFRQAVCQQWETYSKQFQDEDENNESKLTTPSADKVLIAKELGLDKNNNLQEVNRHPGENKIGMVAWSITLFTPQYPNGRDIIVIGNDITHQIGSFGPKEDLLFQLASQLSREKGLPRIYISANSGARIGLAEELKQLFRVAWVDAQSPDKGFRYLYLTPADYMKITGGKSGIVVTELIEDEGEPRYKITDIIGKRDGIGVENLKGSGMIAGETSQAYKEVVTLNLVTCRAIGIGSYLLRLGQRVIQVENSHIILTGSGALNKVLGREVYSSNTQLGGVQIMFNNGVTHLAVPNDYEGMLAIVNWLGFVPKIRNHPLPVMSIHDPVDRPIEFEPSRLPYDPRHMLAGRINKDQVWESGFFDKDSFMEILGMWARTVVCGRARLGGIPCGFIAVETRSVECLVPADPADPETESKLISQAGQVWFPDSAFKTAQAINDLNKEELPLFIFANWRGFSGGMRDMYDQVLKYGAMIVDALHEYNHPVFIYLPPHGELRGGAWVVVDPTINPDHIEMYADKESRGGVLEPEGTVEIKFRWKDKLKTMERLDQTYQQLLEKVRSPGLSIEERKLTEVKIKEREELLAPMYHQVAVLFADLHDTPGRMKEKGVISDVLQWKTSRKYFYWRLRRRLCEQRIINLIREADKLLTRGEIIAMLRRWFVESKKPDNAYLWHNDEVIVEWLQDSLDNKSSVIYNNIQCIKSERITREVDNLITNNESAAVDCIAHISQKLSISERQEIIRLLSSSLEDK